MIGWRNAEREAATKLIEQHGAAAYTSRRSGAATGKGKREEAKSGGGQPSTQGREKKPPAKNAWHGIT